MKVLSKKRQIEIIIESLKKYRKLEDKIDNIFEGNLDKYGRIYDIGFYVIPAILGVEQGHTYDCDSEKLGDLFFDYIGGDITKKEYFRELKKYTNLELED